MLSFGLGLITTYILLWIVPLWLVWPLGVFSALVLVKLIQDYRSLELEDRHILGVLLGAWCGVCYALFLFLTS